MSRLRIPLLSFLAVAFLISPAWAQSPQRGQQLTPESTLNRYGLTRSWWSNGAVNAQRDRLAFIVADETHLFLQATSGVVTAFRADTGKFLWSRLIGSADRSIYPVTTTDALVFVLNGVRLYAIKKDTGDIVWQLGLPGQPASSAAADSLHVYVGFMDGSLYAFNVKKTRELYSENKLPQFSDSAVMWRYRTSKAVSSPAIPAGDLVVFASRNGSLYTVTADERKLVFQFETDAALSAPIVRYRDTLLLASEDFNFYALSLRNGKLGWQFTAGLVIRKAPVLIGDEVYLFPHHGNMYKLSAETGQPFWSVPRMEDFLAATSSRVYVADRYNNLVILARDSGQVLGTMPLGLFTRHFANDRSDRIYVATESGLVMCLHELGREFARFHVHPDRQPILPDFAEESGEPGGTMWDSEAEDADKPGEDMSADEADKPEAESMDEDEKSEAEPPEAEEPEDAE
jgi:outer membrane protein assembly factor BamB